MEHLEYHLNEWSSRIFDFIDSNCWHFVFEYFDLYQGTSLLPHIEKYTDRQRYGIAASKSIFLKEIAKVLTAEGFERAEEGRDGNIAILESLSDTGRLSLTIRNEFDDVVSVSDQGTVSYHSLFENSVEEWRLSCLS